MAAKAETLEQRPKATKLAAKAETPEQQPEATELVATLAVLALAVKAMSLHPKAARLTMVREEVMLAKKSLARNLSDQSCLADMD